MIARFCLMKEKERLPLRFGRNEFAGAFGDLGTDVPLIVLLILTCDLDAGRVAVRIVRPQLEIARARVHRQARVNVQVAEEGPALGGALGAGLPGGCCYLAPTLRGCEEIASRPPSGDLKIFRQDLQD